MIEPLRSPLREHLSQLKVPGCPGEQVLEDFRRGRLSSEEKQSLEVHLEDCASCFVRLLEIREKAILRRRTEEATLQDRVSRFLGSTRENLRTWWKESLWFLVPALTFATVVLFYNPTDKEDNSRIMRGTEPPPYHQIGDAAVVVTTKLTGKEGAERLSVGVLVDQRGWVLTYAHAIHGAHKISVVFNPQFTSSAGLQSSFAAQLVKFDSITDLALLQIEDPPSGFEPIEFGDLAEVKRREEVYSYAIPSIGRDVTKHQAWLKGEALVSDIKDGYEWITKADNKSHRSTVIQTRTYNREPWQSLGFLLNMQGQLIGLNVYQGGKADINSAVGLDAILEFIYRNNK